MSEVGLNMHVSADVRVCVCVSRTGRTLDQFQSLSGKSIMDLLWVGRVFITYGIYH